MKVLIYDKTPRLDAMRYSYDPFVVWLTRTVQLSIHKGDTVKGVGKILAKYLKPLSDSEAVAHFYFDVGERAARNEHTKPWPPCRDLSANRRYNPIKRQKRARTAKA